MPTLEIKTLIKADIKFCFDLARNIDFYKASIERSNESAIAGKTAGLIKLGKWVIWAAPHFGVLGKSANFLFLEQYMLNLLSIRNNDLKTKAEELT